jgi:hypothetical protein
LPDQWKECIIVPVDKKGDKTDCSNYWGISLLSASYKMLSKAYDSVRRDVLYNILIEFRVPSKLVKLIKMCLNKTYSKVGMCKYLYDSFPIQDDLPQKYALSPPHFNFDLECAIRKAQENQARLKLNGTYLQLVHADEVYLLGDNIDAIKTYKH